MARRFGQFQSFLISILMQQPISLLHFSVIFAIQLLLMWAVTALYATLLRMAVISSFGTSVPKSSSFRSSRLASASQPARFPESVQFAPSKPISLAPRIGITAIGCGAVLASKVASIFQ